MKPCGVDEVPHTPMPEVPPDSAEPARLETGRFAPLSNAAFDPPQHGGADALGRPLHDFSTNCNPCGPCPPLVQMLREADATHYPDPGYHYLRERLARWHRVDVGRIVIAASGSEFIQRISACAVRHGIRAAWLPVHAYGDYARAALAHGLAVRHWGESALARPAVAASGVDGPSRREPALLWACDPSSPLGRAQNLPDLEVALVPSHWRVLDRAYAPLLLDGPQPACAALRDDCWQLWTPNKALGLTGIRAAYAIAPAYTPAGVLCSLHELAPSWPIGSHGEVLLHAWTQESVQLWLAQTRTQLRTWMASLQRVCVDMGCLVCEGHRAHFLTARLPSVGGMDATASAAALLPWLRAHYGIKLRDAASFGLPGHVRLCALPPASQAALRQGWQQWRALQEGE